MADWSDLTPAATSPTAPAEDWGGLAAAETPPTAVPSATSPAQSVSAAPPQMSGPLRYPALIGEAALRSAIGVAGWPGSIQHAIGGVDAGMADYLGLPPGSETSMLPTGNELLDKAGRAGLPVKSANLLPEGPEKLLVAAVEGAVSGLPFIPFTGPAGALVPSILGSVASEGAKMAGAPAGASEAAGAIAGGLTGLRNPKTLESLAAQLGSSKNLEDASANLEDFATNWRQSGMDAKIDAARAPLDAKVPGSANVVPAETLARANDLTAQGSPYKAGVAKQVFADAIRSGGALAATAKDIATGAPVTWDDFKDFRTYLGTTLRSARPAERPALEHLYGGATTDLGTTATAAGAGDEFANFNAVSTSAHQFDSGPIEQILSSKRPEQAAKRILALGPDAIDAIRAESPDVANDLAAAHLRSGGWPRSTPGTQASLVPDTDFRLSVSAASSPRRAAPGTHSLQGILAGEIGHAAGSIGASLIGSGPVGQAAVAAGSQMLGAAVPSIVRGARALHPSNTLLPAAIGAVGATNPLQIAPALAQ